MVSDQLASEGLHFPQKWLKGVDARSGLDLGNMNIIVRKYTRITKRSLF